jgi:F-type H+/Na+-transporting ATPase subunit alpha
VGLSVSRVGSAAQIKAMKQVAGGMKLALAQYRELAAFAQFGSDLDKATQETLANGERLVEILKQGQYEPMSVERQVLQIYAATNRDDPKKRGWLRDIPTPDVIRWAKEFIDFVEAKNPGIPKEIREKRELSNELKALINSALTEFNGLFKATEPKA